MTPQTKYARSGDVSIAYRVSGRGPVDLVFVNGFVSNVEHILEEPRIARFVDRLGSFARVITFDKRGTGLSDRVPIATLEQRMDDVRAVMDAVGAERAVLLGISEGGPMCMLFAATYPDRTVALALCNSFARSAWAPDYTWARTDQELEAFIVAMKETWGTGASALRFAPSAAGDPAFREWCARYERQGASPGAVEALLRMKTGRSTRGMSSARSVYPRS